jgi:hypothetical protein
MATMSIAEIFVLIFLGLALLVLEAEATSRRRGLGDADDEEAKAGQTVFNVNSYGAKADGITNNDQVSSETMELLGNPL